MKKLIITIVAILALPIIVYALPQSYLNEATLIDRQIGNQCVAYAVCNAIESQMTDTQLALVEIYEGMVMA